MLLCIVCSEDTISTTSSYNKNMMCVTYELKYKLRLEMTTETEVERVRRERFRKIYDI